MCRHECEAGEPVAVPGGVCLTCPKWEAEGSTAAAPDPYGQYTPIPPYPGPVDLPRWQPIPPPTVAPTCLRLVITVAVGDEGERTHALTRASQQRYAERIGADHIALTDQTQPWFMLEKFRYGSFVPHYPGGTLCLDADVWVSRSAPDLFEQVSPDQIGVSIAHDVRANGLLPHFARQLADVCQSQTVPIPPGADQTHWNSGLVVLRPEHVGYWTPPTRPIPKHWIAEEL